MQRPFFSQSPNRVGSGPVGPPISLGILGAASPTWGSAGLVDSTGADGGLGWVMAIPCAWACTHLFIPHRKINNRRQEERIRRPQAIDTSALARGVALEILSAVLRRRRPLDEMLDRHPGLAGLSDRDRAFTRLLVATALRRLGQIDTLIGHCLETPLPQKAGAAHDILRLGVAQLVFLDTPAHAAVDTAVGLAATAAPPFKKLINAVLRRLAGEGKDLAAAHDAARLDTPDWLWQSWHAAYGPETCAAIAAAHLTEAPLDLTVRGDAPAWAERLGATLLPTGGLRLAGHGTVTALPGFDEGAWWVQDMAAALPARLLGPVAGALVADLCAAPGGKTAQLAAAGAHVTAIDRSATRLQRLSANLVRLGLQAEVVVADVAQWQAPALFDAVLVDAPCSATGTLRRHPDVARLKGPADVARLAAAQDALLAIAVAMTRPGGRLVYCVCSLQPEEGIDRIAALLAGGAPLRRLPLDPAEVGGLAELISADGDLRTLPCHLAELGGMDAFYAARLERL